MQQLLPSNKNTLHHAIGPFLALAQCFGVLPVLGLWPSSPIGQVRFRWLTPALLLCSIVLIYAVFELCLCLQIIVEFGLNIETIGPLSFAIICIACFSIFLSLSQRWPQLIRQTARCEFIFHQPGYDCPLARQFGTRLRCWGFTLLVAAFCEHSIYLATAFYNNSQQIVECNLKLNFWQNYFQRERQEFFMVFPLNLLTGIFIEWTTLAMTFVWNFVDIFLILICRSLQLRLKQLHWRILQHANAPMSDEFWAQLRYDLMDSSDLVDLYDKELSNLILLACAHNMFFLCVEIYQGFKALRSFMDELYFWFCLLYVTFRFFNMLFAAASIPEVADNISSTLYEISQEFWCLELGRIHEIISSNSFSFSGKGYFLLNRRLILGLVATLISYELVLINQISDMPVQKSPCGRGPGYTNSIFNL